MKITMLLCVLVCGGFLAHAATEYTFDDNKDGRPDKWYNYEDGYVALEKSDLNFDGRVDLIVEFEKNGKKKYEALDNNYDGVMDAFYYYEQGKASLQTVDSNYDGRIDVWIHMDGVYVLRYEEDVDFDGAVDKTKIFGAR